MNTKTLIKYLDFKMREREAQEYRDCFFGDSISLLATNLKRKDKFDYINNYMRIWGKAPEEDTRTAGEIIRDTFAKHGLTLSVTKKQDAI